jgi:hypothetical protein
MKSYAEILKSSYIGRRGTLYVKESISPHHVFLIKKSSPDSGDDKLVDVGTDYAEFSWNNRQRFVPLNLLVLDVE